ncbi:hypothetical protein B5807_05013 [Epicoccum nigrum]|uniref:Uncharacterized protein n=1 Tax=Epicoccum nigrum TaxID=105696 RepID=A0A1Y2M1R1_EPING|nr:hypothetical protein B5807_05013 [Epicoccum nigrum]
MSPSPFQNSPSSHTPAAPQPSHGTPPRPRLPPHYSPATMAHDAPFSEAQRSAQARGKPFADTHAPLTNTNTNANANTARTLSGTLRSSGAAARAGPAVAEAESYAQREARNEAAAILDSEEMLMWYAAARYESVSQTRRFFRNVVFGVGGDEVVWREEWEREGRRGDGGAVGGSGSPRGKGKGKAREGERERTPRKRGEPC